MEPHEILALISAGGMGEVNRARDRRLGRDVAIKVLPAESPIEDDVEHAQASRDHVFLRQLSCTAGTSVSAAAIKVN
jgi:serine/threonine protein kinase